MQIEEKIWKLTIIIVNDVHLQEDDKIREGWDDYFTKLSTATNDPSFDQDYKAQLDSDIFNIKKLASQEKELAITFELENLFETIHEIKKNGKSPDGEGIIAEHLKFGGTLLLQYLQKLFGKIIKEREIPQHFKNWIIYNTNVQEIKTTHLGSKFIS